MTRATASKQICTNIWDVLRNHLLRRSPNSPLCQQVLAMWQTTYVIVFATRKRPFIIWDPIKSRGLHLGQYMGQFLGEVLFGPQSHNGTWLDSGRNHVKTATKTWQSDIFQESSGSLGNSLQASLMHFATLRSSVCHVHENCHVRGPHICWQRFSAKGK